jgi:hypothetical protein
VSAPSTFAEPTATGVRLFYGLIPVGASEPVWRFRDLELVRGASDERVANLVFDACSSMWPEQAIDVPAVMRAVLAAIERRGNPVTAGRLVATNMQLLATDVYERFTVFGMGFVGGLASFIAAAKSSQGLAGSALIAITLLLISLVCGLGALLLGWFTAQSRLGIGNRELIRTMLTELNVQQPNVALRAMIAAQWRHLPCTDRRFLRPLMRSVVERRMPNAKEQSTATDRLAAAARSQSLLARFHLVLGVLAAVIYVIGSVAGA